MMNLHPTIKRLAKDILKSGDSYYQLFRHPEHRFKIDSSYTYCDNLIDIPYGVLAGTIDFKEWCTETKKKQQAISDSIPLSKPSSLDIVKEYDNVFGRMKEYRLTWQNDSPLYRSVFGGTIALPKDFDETKPLIVFIHGHGMVRNFSGEHRSDLFTVDDLANQVLKRGYVVWAPDNVIHDQLMPLFRLHDFSDMWAKIINQSWPIVKAILPTNQKRYVMGLAAGGATGLSMIQTNAEIDGLITSGIFFPLDLARRDYRLKNHPFCFDFRKYISFLPLYAMALDRPLHIQMGRQDGLWIGNINMPSESYSGLKRPVMTEETMGAIFILKQLSNIAGQIFSFKLSEKGHQGLDFNSAFEFINSI
jgi:hypothetical protein